MKNITVFTQHGQITGYFTVPDSEVSKLVGDFWVEGISDPLTDYVADNVITKKPPQPTQYHTFDYVTRQWVPDSILAGVGVRSNRDRLLLASDWTQLPDAPLAAKAAWAVYRQELRDITDQPGYPFNIIWPTPPQ